MNSVSVNSVAAISFDQIANYVAIAGVSNPTDSVKQLLLQCFAIMTEDQISSAAQLQEITEALFAISLSNEQVQEGVDSLIDEGKLLRLDGRTMVIEPSLRSLLQENINRAQELEMRIKAQWFDELRVTCPGLSSDQLWKALRSYLGKAFRRHGMQTLSLLDPNVDTLQEHCESLSNMLEQSVKEYFSTVDYSQATNVLSRFIADVGTHNERSTFIAQLADGAFHFFTLAVDPAVAEELRKNLSELTLFCDTNFLFGILDLHAHPQVQVSHDLLKATRDYKLPIKLRYHEATLKEMRGTVYYYGDTLRSRRWSQNLSRAALKSLSLSGIEIKYHQMNIETPIDPESFFSKYEHLDVLLKEEGIDVHRVDSDRTMERALLYAEYEAYRGERHKDKVYESMDHDVTVLDAVKMLRSSSKSSLDAKALMITCDYTLYRFDWELARYEKELACTVIPNTFWQLIRPYIPSGDGFDKSFAETFAIPEFRAMGSGAARACSRMLAVLALYKDLSEETATRLLSNRMLIDKLRHVEDQQEFERIIESAMALEVQTLSEETAALQKQLEEEHAERCLAEARAAEAKEEKERAEEQNLLLAAELEKERNRNLEAQETVNNLKEGENNALSNAKDAQEALHGEATKLETVSHRSHLQDSTIAKYQVFTALLLSILIIAATEAAVYFWKWTWLIEHKQSYGIQGLFICLVIVVCLLCICTKHRRTILLYGALATVATIVAAMLQLLGGKPAP